MKYHLVVCGGTFDRLHQGHKAFLEYIFSLSDQAVIGLTSDLYIATHKKNHDILPFQIRKKELEVFLQKKGWGKKAVIYPIDNVYGETLDASYAFEAIIVTEATIKGAEEINKKRKEIGLAELPVEIGPMVFTNGQIISSTLIRSGTFGRNGEFFPDDTWANQTLILSNSLREILHQPFGKIFPSVIPQEILTQSEKIVTVGDATTERFNTLGILQKISIVDLKVERKETYHSLEELGFTGKENIFQVHNPAGSLTPALWQTIKKIISQRDSPGRFVIQVYGEEDLAVIPLVLLLPLDFKIFYGQPAISQFFPTQEQDSIHEGVVYIEVNEEIKKEVFSFLQQFVTR